MPNAELIFPALDQGSRELEMCRGPTRSDGNAPMSVANKIVAIVDAGQGDAAARIGRTAAQQALRSFADPVRVNCKGLLASGIDEIWDEQLATFLEFNAAWSPLEDTHRYEDVRCKVEAALGARKRLRDFGAWKHERAGVPKSSLDGARETVLNVPQQRATHLVRKYRIANGEQLDAIGLVKRAGGEPEQFVPVANVALAAWLQSARRFFPVELERLENACAEVGLGGIDRADLRWTSAFSRDALVFFPDRWEPILKEAQYAGGARAWGEVHVKPILDKTKRLGAPSPYVACLVADGDHIGKALEGLTTCDKQRTFARNLSQFAADARTIVEQNHRGVLVYGGGDDVLAFVCLDDALACADALQKAFADATDHALRACGDTDTKRPTLSVGLGIGHVMERMGHLLELGRRAEERAKNARHKGEGDDRNALAMLLDKRSGGETSCRMRWDHPDVGPRTRIELDRDLLRGRLSMKKVHEIGSDVGKLPPPSILQNDEARDFARLLVDDVKRTLLRTNEGQGVHLSEVGLALNESSSYETLRQRVLSWVDRMTCAFMFEQSTLGFGVERHD